MPDEPLTDDDRDLLQDCIAAELARCLVAGVEHNDYARARFDALVDLGKRMGLEL